MRQFKRVGRSLARIQIDNAMWSWWTTPIAVRRMGRYDRTYVGYVDSEGTPRVAQYDHDSGGFVTQRLGLAVSQDDHNAPAILTRAPDNPDDGMCVFWVGHNDEELIRYRRADVDDIRHLGDEMTIETSGRVSYIQAYENKPDEIVLVSRLGGLASPTWTMFRSEDFGETWSAEMPFLSGQALYTASRRSATNRHTIRFVVGTHPEDSTDQRIGYFHVNLDGGSVQLPGPVTIANVYEQTNTPISMDDVLIVRDPDPGIRTRVFDIASTRPAIAFVEYPDGQPQNGMYYVARWDGNQFNIEQVVASGHPFHNSNRNYFGGMAFSDTRDDVVYLSREDDGTWYIEEYVRDGNGNWNRSAVLSSGATKRIRPIAVVNGRDDLNCLWLYGQYEHYLDFRTRTDSTPFKPSGLVSA